MQPNFPREIRPDCQTKLPVVSFGCTGRVSFTSSNFSREVCFQTLATQRYPLFASLLEGWDGSSRSENQNLWAMFAIVKGPSTFRWLMLSTERIDKTGGWYWACANTIRQCITGWWVGHNQKSEATTATQGRDLLSTRIFDKSEMGAGCGIFGNKWYNFFL